MIAVIQTGGKQYLVQQGDIITVGKLAANLGDKLDLEVLMTAEGDKLEVGTPLLSKTVQAEVVLHFRAPKIEVVKYKAKSRYTRRVGHRQDHTKIKIVKI